MRTRAHQLESPEQPSGSVLAPGWTTLELERQSADYDERMVRVARVLIMPCRLCRVRGGESCRPTGPGDTDLYLLDREHGILAHGTRIGFAVKKGTALIQEVVAQFDGKTPDSVWKAAL
jgi:hypothetical protein